MSFVSSVTKDVLSIWFNKHTEEGEKIAELAINSELNPQKLLKEKNRLKVQRFLENYLIVIVKI
jgi:topoisomerase-4 subunit B